MPYTTQDKVLEYLGLSALPSPLTSLTNFINSVEAFIEDYCDREFETESATYKLYDGDGTDELLIDDLISLTKVEILDEDGVVDFTLDETSEYYLYPANKTPKTKISINKNNATISIFPVGKQNVKVTGSFGFSATVPADIILAATKLVAALVGEGHQAEAGDVKSERLGEYEVTFQDIEEVASHLGVFQILDRYRIPPI